MMGAVAGKSRSVADRTAIFLLVLSVILAPIRLGESELLRPIVLIGFPALIWIFIAEGRTILRLAGRRDFVAPIALFVFMLLGYLLENDVLPGADYRDLSLQSLVSAPAFFFLAVHLSRSGKDPLVIGVAIAIGVIVHVAGAILLPAQVEYKDFTRATGFLPDPNILLLHILPPVLLLPAFGFSERRWRPVFLMLLLGVVWATLLSMSRAGLACIAIVFVLWAILGAIAFTRSSSAWKRDALSWSALLIVVGAVFFTVNADTVKSLADITEFRITERVDDAGLVGDRVGLYEMFFDQEIFNILSPIGIGYVKALRGSGTLPHNTFIDSWIVGGFFAFVGAIFIYTKFSLLAMRNVFIKLSARLNVTVDIWVAAALVSQLVLVATLSVFVWKCNWVCLGLVVGVLMRRSRFLN